MSDFFIKLIVGLMKALFGAAVPKEQDGAKPGDFEEKLKAKIKKDGWK